MVVRIRISTRFPQVDSRASREMLSGLAGLLTLASVSCFTMSAWKIMADLGWAGAFFQTRGFFSHWQVWISCAVAAQLVSFRLARPKQLIS
jgi:hypothetical protein